MATATVGQSDASKSAVTLPSVLSGWLVAPFDGLRVAHAFAVKAGWAPGSMLASRDFERVLVALERVTLGTFARSV